MTFGVMFHHFHNKYHSKSQGSISSNQLTKIIKYLRKKYILLNAKDYLEKIKNKNIKSNEICLTFDDCLKSQFNIAVPILKKEKIKAFFFIYSGIFKKNYNNLEIFRDFRNSKFKNLEDFYTHFFTIFEKYYNKEFKNFKKKFKKNYLEQYSFYTLSDRKFRFCRDRILNKKSFDKLMFIMMRDRKYNYKASQKKLFMTKKNIKSLIRKENIVGLHSDSHPANIYSLNFKKQYSEYKRNYNFLLNNFDLEADTMSHPFGRYNKTTLKVLKKLGIKLGFLSSYSKKKSNLEIPRTDHTKYLNQI